MASADRSLAGTGDSAPGEGSGDGGGAGGHAGMLEQYFDTDGLFQLRSAVAAHAARLGVSEPRLADLVLVAHELASNAVRHGRATRGDPGRLRLWVTGDHVLCEISDHGPGIVDPATVGVAPPPPGNPGGRGLWIVRQVVEHVDIRTGPRGTTVVATMAL